MNESRRGTSIRIYLADGTPDGLRIVEKSNWTGRALMVSRSQYPEIRSRKELRRPGVYVLIGQAEERSYDHRIYIGEADDARSRIDDHVRKRDFWNELILFTSKDANLNKAHVRYLEARLLAIAAEARQAEFENSNATQCPPLSEADIDDIETYLENMLLIYPLLGVTAFDIGSNSKAPQAETVPLLLLGGPQAEGKGRDLPEGFVVYEGAIARRREVKSIHAYLSALRRTLKEDGVLVDGPEGRWTLTRDYRFKSPSMAAAVLLGRNANGRIEWKDDDGRTLKAIQEAALANY